MSPAELDHGRLCSFTLLSVYHMSCFDSHRLSALLVPSRALSWHVGGGRQCHACYGGLAECIALPYRWGCGGFDWPPVALTQWHTNPTVPTQHHSQIALYSCGFKVWPRVCIHSRYWGFVNGPATPCNTAKKSPGPEIAERTYVCSLYGRSHGIK